MSGNLTFVLREVRRNQRGQVAVLAGIAIVAIIGFAAIVVDIVSLFHDYEMLQAATNAAALAGAQDINCCVAAPGRQSPRQRRTAALRETKTPTLISPSRWPVDIPC
jgi:hypothetical protein